MTFSIQRTLSLGAVLIVCVSLPIVVRLRGNLALQRKSSFIAEQANEMVQVMAENHNLSNRVAQIESDQLTLDDRLELARLRSGISALRNQTNLTTLLERENSRLTTRADAAKQLPDGAEVDSATELMDETVRAAATLFSELPAAMTKYRAEHTNQFPDDFAQLRPYFPKVGDQPMEGLFTFGFFRFSQFLLWRPSLKSFPPDLPILVSRARKDQSGRWYRTVVLGDGSVLVEDPLASEVRNWDQAWEQVLTSDRSR